MADDEPESFIEKMTREMRLPLDVEGGRVFAHHADADATERCTIELKCSWSPGLLAGFDTHIRIGDDKHKPLSWDDDGVQIVDTEAEEVVGCDLLECPIMLSLYRVDDKWITESAANNEGKPILGRFDYHAPIQTSDGVVNEKRPVITAWAGFGHDNFELLRARLLATENPDFDLGLDVEFPRGTVDAGWVSTKIEWDGKDSIPVLDAVIVWKCGDWDSKTDRLREVFREREPEPYNPPREHVALLHAVNKLEAAIAKLAVPVWLAAAAAVLAAIAAR